MRAEFETRRKKKKTLEKATGNARGPFFAEVKHGHQKTAASAVFASFNHPNGLFMAAPSCALNLRDSGTWAAIFLFLGK